MTNLWEYCNPYPPQPTNNPEQVTSSGYCRAGNTIRTKFATSGIRSYKMPSTFLVYLNNFILNGMYYVTSSVKLYFSKITAK